MEKGTIFQTEIGNKTIEAVVVDDFSSGENDLGDICVTHICYAPANHILFYFHQWIRQDAVPVGIDEFGDDILEWQEFVSNQNVGAIIAKAYLPEIDTALEERS